MCVKVIKREALLVCMLFWLLWWIQVRPSVLLVSDLKRKVAQRMQEDQAAMLVNQHWYQSLKRYPWLIHWQKGLLAKKIDRPKSPGIKNIGSKQSHLSGKCQQIEWVYLGKYQLVARFLSTLWQSAWGRYLDKISLKKTERGLLQLRVVIKMCGGK